MTRVFVAGYYGFGNTGDEVILDAMVAELRALRPGLAVTVTSATPRETAAAHGVDAVRWCDVAVLDAAVAASDLVLIGGGGLFFDTFGFDPRWFMTDNHTGIAFYTCPAVLGARHGKPVMLYAIGAGPIVTDAGRRFTRIACDLAKVITVRDPESKDVLASIGVPVEKVEVTADPAFAFAPGAAPAPHGERPRVAVATRPWDVGDPEGAWERALVAALDAFLDRCAGTVLYVPFQRLPGMPEDDVRVAERCRRRMRHASRADVLGGPVDPATTYAALAAADLVVGVRLHSMVLAALARRPAVALDYDPKVGAVMRRLGLAARCLPLVGLDAAALGAAMDAALASDESERARLARTAAALGDLARRNAAAAIALLR